MISIYLDFQTALMILAVLCVVELCMIAIVRRSTSQMKRTLDRILAGQSLDQLEPEQREAMFSKAAQEFSQTIYRKLELLVIGYHLPALASWVAITRKRTTSPTYYF